MHFSPRSCEGKETSKMWKDICLFVWLLPNINIKYLNYLENSCSYYCDCNGLMICIRVLLQGFWLHCVGQI